MSGSNLQDNLLDASPPAIPAGGSPPIDGLDEILQWSATGPVWQKDVLRRLCIGPERDAADEKAHDHLGARQRAGLVGTNTIRQNYSRAGVLDYIVAQGGTITEAVFSIKWSGDAAVDVSIVNWVKGKKARKKRLYIQKGSDPS